MPLGPPWMHDKLRERGCRHTRPREFILNVLSETKEHLSAEDVYLKVHKVYSNIGLTTVYRTLELLVNMGVLVKIDFGDGRARYEMADGYSKKEHHHHLTCINCKTTFDYSDFMEHEKEFLENIEHELSKKFDFEITGHHIEFQGRCKKCR